MIDRSDAVNLIVALADAVLAMDEYIRVPPRDDSPRSLWHVVRLAAEVSDWKRDEGESLAEWAERTLAKRPTEADQRDAARYRWLRAQEHVDIAACWLVKGDADTPEQLDEAIDDAMRRSDTEESK